MSKAISWEHHKHKMKSANGVNPYRSEYFLSKCTSESQYSYVMGLIDLLAKNGIDAKWVLRPRKPSLRPTYGEIIETLRTIMRDNNLFGDTRTEYLNLCKHRETGKKIKYRTTKFASAPVGYEFIGQLSKEVILIAPDAN